MITAQADGWLKGIASHEWNRSNSLSGIFVGQGLRRGVEEGDESILVDFGGQIPETERLWAEGE